MPGMDKRLLPQMWRFGLVGVVGYIVNASMVEALAPGMGPIGAQTLAFPVAATVTWWFNRRYTFGASHRAIHHEWLRFLLANALGWVANNGVYVWMVFSMPLAYKHPALAVAGGSLAGMVFNFIMSRRVVFNAEYEHQPDYNYHANMPFMSKRQQLIFLPFFLIMGGLTSLSLGQDANWDLKNYHLYNAFALLNGRLGRDIFAAGIQTYFHPLLDVPYYVISILALPGHPKVVAFLMGFPYGILSYFVFLIAFNLFSSLQHNKYATYGLSTAATLFGVTGSATISQVGTTFNEIPIAALILAGIVLIFSKLKNDKKNNLWTIFYAGLLFGAAAGLKLTAATYAPGAAIGLFLISQAWRKGLANTAVFCFGWALAFLVIWGWWGLRLYELTDNPVFPMFNSIFHSPWISEESVMDNRFKPGTVIQTVFYPFYWAVKGSITVAEPAFFDPRFAVSFASFLMLLVLILINLARSAAANPYKTPTNLKFLLIFIFVSYTVWEAMFSILRYAVTIESLLGLIVFAFLFMASKAFKPALQFTILSIISLVVILTTYFMTSYPEWGRAGFSTKVLNVSKSNLPINSLVLLLDKPVAYIAPFIARDNSNVTFIGITPDLPSKEYRFGKLVAETISAHPGEIYFVARPQTLHVVSALSGYGLFQAKEPCQTIVSNIDEPIHLCLLTKR